MGGRPSTAPRTARGPCGRYAAAREAGPRAGGGRLPPSVTGGGPGAMAATCTRQGGRGQVACRHFNIDLPPHEQRTLIRHRQLTFRHFSVRKTMFVKAAEGFVSPGASAPLERGSSLTLIPDRQRCCGFPAAYYFVAQHLLAADAQLIKGQLPSRPTDGVLRRRIVGPPQRDDSSRMRSRRCCTTVQTAIRLRRRRLATKPSSVPSGCTAPREQRLRRASPSSKRRDRDQPLWIVKPLESVAVMVCTPGVRRITPVKVCWAVPRAVGVGAREGRGRIGAGQAASRRLLPDAPKGTPTVAMLSAAVREAFEAAAPRTNDRPLQRHQKIALARPGRVWVGRM